MGTILSAGTGNHNVGGTWVGGVAPGASDFASIEVGHVVTVVADWTVKGIIYNGGSLVRNYDIIISDASGAGLTFNAVNSGGDSSNGTAASPRKIKSAAAIPTKPTYPWSISMAKIAATDSRSFNFKYTEFQGNKFYIGNSSNYAHMNDSSNPNIITCNVVNPYSRENGLTENRVRRRTGRIYNGSMGAASMTITGLCRDDSYFYYIIDDIIKSGERIAFFSQFVHLPKCKIDGKPLFQSKGGRDLSFNIMLLEDE